MVGYLIPLWQVTRKEEIEWPSGGKNALLASWLAEPKDVPTLTAQRIEIL